MRVVGTAGHVDHGKTALIRSLTGMDADRLPEEKARGMTTDLGFAWYEDGPRGTIGVVDVPGHERYLRNMVAGAWGLDLVMLTVAADDGWMPQTELHASIAAALAAPAVVVAVTKADAVPPERVAMVRADAEARAEALFGARPESVAVSNLSGHGIPELKAAVGRALGARLEKAAGEDRGAALFVDRVFSPRGGGLVAAGTLAGGAVAVGDELCLLPRGERVRVRGVQCYGRSRERAEPGTRTALALAGLKEAPRRGDLLAALGLDPLSGDEILARLLPLPGTVERFRVDERGRARVRGGLSVELAVGTARSDAELWPLPGGRYARLVLAEPLACPLGSPLAILAKGGAALLCRGVALRADRLPAPGRRALVAALPRVEALAEALEADAAPRAGSRAVRVAGPSVTRAVALALEASLRGWVRVPPSFPAAGLSAAALEAGGLVLLHAARPIAAQPGEEALCVLFDSTRLTEAGKAIKAAAGEPGGLSKAGAVSLFGGDEAAAGVALDWYEAYGDIAREGGAWRRKGEARRLSPEEAAVESRLKAAGKAGLEPGKTAPQSEARVLKALCSFGLAMPLDGGIFLAKAAYDDCVAAVLAGRAVGERFSVPEAKERAGLSRKYILPLLNRMEDKGLVKRSGDERVVLKALS